MRPERRPRLAVLAPYWAFWEHTAGPDFRADREGLARAVAAHVQDMAEVVAVELVDSRESGQRVAAQLEDVHADVLLIAQSMAASPAYLLACLDALPTLPIVIWAVHRSVPIMPDFDHAAITTAGATVGTPQLTNTLVRRGRAFDLVLGRVEDPPTVARVRDAVRLAGVAAGLRSARLGRVGRPIDGYECVDVDDSLLQAATGIAMIPIAPEEFVERWRAVGPVRLRQLEAEVDAIWQRAPDLEEGETLQRSLRAAAALEQLVDDYALDAGAMNCHVPQIRLGEEIGIAPCYGLGRLTSLGVPWTCTGDVLTAVAMLSVKRLGGAAVYHELEAVDYATGELVIANSGEHDLGWCAPGERPVLRRNSWFEATDARCGACGSCSPAPGPATLVGFTPHPRAERQFQFVIAPGELTARRFPATGTTNGAFRFASGPVGEAWVRWARAGVNHHSCATPGDYADAVEGVARQLGVDAVRV